MVGGHLATVAVRESGCVRRIAQALSIRAGAGLPDGHRQHDRQVRRRQPGCPAPAGVARRATEGVSQACPARVLRSLAGRL
ncbi:hypothetical protein G6F66_014456 [Rhizopus arrhizus]|nr:hypothetical protein G6F66_014456 [Rhizopus arrhizus]